MIVKKSGILIPVDHPEFLKIKKHLTRVVVNWDDSLYKMELFITNSNGIIVPRFYPVDDNIVDQSILGEDISVLSKVIPRSRRQELAIEFFKYNKNGILQLEPGSGKTVISIAGICGIGKKTIILTHKLSLVSQWKNEILNFTNLSEDDIGLLKTKKFSTIFKKPIIISTVQTIISGLNNKKFVEELLNCNIGVAIFDECHTTIGPEVFSKVSLSLNCSRVYGLSATPRRFDNSDVLEYHLGKVTYFKPEDGEILKPIVYMLYFSFGVYSKYEKYIMWGGKFQYSRYEKQMSKIDKYIEKVSSIIRDAYIKGNRTILVLGKNINTLIKMAEKCEIKKEDVGIFMPTASKEQILSVSDITDMDDAFHTKKVVFATYQAARDGNSRKSLDCLILTTPTGNVEQAVGRILREVEGKLQPVVIDLVDMEGPKVWSLHDQDRKNYNNKIGQFIKSAEKRIEIYNQFGWEIKKKNLK